MAWAIPPEDCVKTRIERLERNEGLEQELALRPKLREPLKIVVGGEELEIAHLGQNDPTSPVVAIYVKKGDEQVKISVRRPTFGRVQLKALAANPEVVREFTRIDAAGNPVVIRGQVVLEKMEEGGKPLLNANGDAVIVLTEEGEVAEIPLRNLGIYPPRDAPRTASGVVDVPASLDHVDLPASRFFDHPRRISTTGEGRFVSYFVTRDGKVKRMSALVTRIWSDAHSVIHVEVALASEGKLLRPRELTPDEIATLQVSDAAQRKFEPHFEDPKPRAAPLQRRYPPLSAVGMDTIWVRGGVVRGLHQDEIPFFKDEEILSVTAPRRSRTFRDPWGGTVQVGYDPTGRSIVQQQAIRGCTAAVVEMLAMDQGLALDARHLQTVNLGNTDTMTQALRQKGLVPKVSHGDAREIAERVRKDGPGILSIEGEIGGHVVVLDEIDEAKQTATIRDPYHGWQIQVPLSSLLRRTGKRLDLIQARKP